MQQTAAKKQSIDFYTSQLQTCNFYSNMQIYTIYYKSKNSSITMCKLASNYSKSNFLIY